MPNYHIGFKCLHCDREFTQAQITYTCPNCGGNVDAIYDYVTMARTLDPRSIASRADRSIWHYEELLPVTLPAEHKQHPTPLSLAGWSPLYRAVNLEKMTHTRKVWLKDDSRLPSASFKDRASAMIVAYALQNGKDIICCASTGNAASALSTMCSATALRAVIFVPQSSPEGKLAQTLIHGAKVYAVPGTYTTAVHIASKASAKYGWYNRNTGKNPYTREGKKTAGYEIAEQLAMVDNNPSQAFRSPDVVVVPVGDGNIISGIYKGFRDLYTLGWVSKIPKFIGVTATLAPSMYRAWQSGGIVFEEFPAQTIASGISVDVPEDGVAGLRAIRETGGVFVEASDEEMLNATVFLAGHAAVFTEPASAAAYVGLQKARQLGAISADDEVVLQLTASGFKDVRSALKAAPKPIFIKDLDDVSA